MGCWFCGNDRGEPRLNEEDIELIRCAQQGNMQAFEQIVQNYRGFVFKTAYGVMQNRTDATDIVQETFVKVFISLKNLKELRTFPTWIAQITIRNALDVIAKHRRMYAVHADIETLDAGENAFEGLDLRIDIQQGLQKLSVEHRTALILREVQGFNYEEISKILDIPLGTVRSRIHHAREQLRRVLQGQKGMRSDE